MTVHGSMEMQGSWATWRTIGVHHHHHHHGETISFDCPVDGDLHATSAVFCRSFAFRASSVSDGSNEVDICLPILAIGNLLPSLPAKPRFITPKTGLRFPRLPFLDVS